MAKASIAGSSALDSAAQVGTMVFGLAAGVVLANMLGAAGRGAYVFATSFAGMLVLGFANLGLELAASVLVAKEPRRAGEVHGVIILASVAIGAVILAAMRLFFDTIRGSLLPGIGADALLVLAVAMPFWVYQYGCFGILIGLGRTPVRSAFELGMGFVQNAAVVGLLLASRGWDVGARVEVLVFAYYGLVMVGALVMAVLLGRRAAPRMPGMDTLRRFHEFGTLVYVGNLASNLGQRVDQYFVQQVGRDDTAFGVYTLATGLAARTRVFPQALSRGSYARLCSAESTEAARLVAACFRQVTAIGLVVLVLGAVASPLLPLIYSREFAGAVLPFIIFLVGRVFHNGSWMLANYFSGHLARPGIPMLVNWVLLPVQALLAWFAMHLGGLVAVALITSASYVLLFAAFLALFLRWQKVVGLRDLLVLTVADITPWRALIARILGFRRRRA